MQRKAEILQREQQPGLNHPPKHLLQGCEIIPNGPKWLGLKPHTSTSRLYLIYNLYVSSPPKGRIDWEVTVEKVIHHKPLFSSPLQKPDVSVCSQLLRPVSISAAAAAWRSG